MTTSSSAPQQQGPAPGVQRAKRFLGVGDESAGANSDDFVIGHAVIVSSADSYRSQSDVDADVALYHSQKLPPCLEQMKDLLIPPAGVTIESASIKITPGWAGGPANVAVTGTGTVKVLVNGQQVPLYTTFAFITGPLIEAWVSAWSGGAPVPASVIDPLVAKVATRAAKG
jgi:hypothetical protein